MNSLCFNFFSQKLRFCLQDVIIMEDIGYDDRVDVFLLRCNQFFCVKQLLVCFVRICSCSPFKILIYFYKVLIINTLTICVPGVRVFIS